MSVFIVEEGAGFRESVDKPKGKVRLAVNNIELQEKKPLIEKGAFLYIKGLGGTILNLVRTKDIEMDQGNRSLYG